VESTWTGIRPLVLPCNEDETHHEKDDFDYQTEDDNELKADYSSIRRVLQGWASNSTRWVIYKIQGAVYGQKDKSSKNVSRKHIVEYNENTGLISLMGGKWTSYRKMGIDTVKYALQKNPSLHAKYDQTQTLKFNLIGAYSAMEVINDMKSTQTELEKSYIDNLVFMFDLPRDVS
jgi:glycerol-3-phosphate dehydrogenase